MEGYIVTPQGRPFGWQPKSTSCISEWLQVDLLLDNYTIKGVATQGCRARTSKSLLSVTKYELEYSSDSKMFYTDHRVSLFRFSSKEIPKLNIYFSRVPQSWNTFLYWNVWIRWKCLFRGQKSSFFIWSAIFVFTTETTQPHPQVFSVNGALTCKEAGLLTSSVEWSQNSSTFGHQWLFMVNYACAFSQSESG